MTNEITKCEGIHRSSPMGGFRDLLTRIAILRKTHKAGRSLEHAMDACTQMSIMINACGWGRGENVGVPGMSHAGGTQDHKHLWGLAQYGQHSATQSQLQTTSLL